MKIVLAALVTVSSLSANTALAMQSHNDQDNACKAYGAIRIGYGIEKEEKQKVNVSEYFDELTPVASGTAIENNRTWTNADSKRKKVQDGSISVSDATSELLQNNDLITSLKRDDGATMSLAIGVNMNSCFAAELQYTRFFGHELKNQDDSRQWFVRTVPAAAGGGTAYDPSTDELNADLYPVGSLDFANKGKAFTEIKRNIHTVLARGIVMHNFEPLEINANFGIGLAKITGERIIKDTPGAVRPGHNDPDPAGVGNANVGKANNPKEVKSEKDINDTSMAFSAGVGLGFHLSEDMKFVVGYDYIHMDKVENIKNDMHHVTGGIVFAF